MARAFGLGALGIGGVDDDGDCITRPTHGVESIGGVTRLQLILEEDAWRPCGGAARLSQISGEV